MPVAAARLIGVAAVAWLARGLVVDGRSFVTWWAGGAAPGRAAVPERGRYTGGSDASECFSSADQGSHAGLAQLVEQPP